MRFLFVHSWRGFSLAEWTLREAIAAGCAEPVTVRALDLPADGVPADDLLPRVLAAWKPDLVGFSCHFWSLPAFLEAALWVKHLSPRARIVFGGPQVSSVDTARALLKQHRAVDFVIRGPGEESLCRLLEWVARRDVPLEKIPGLSFRGPGRLLHAPVREPSRPTRGPIFHSGNTELVDLLAQLEVVSYETLRGCRSHCAYCVYPIRRFALLDDPMVEAELAYLCSVGIPTVRIGDSHFGGTPGRAKKLLKLLSRVNRRSRIKLYPDLHHVDPEYVELLGSAGAEVTSIGIQSTNPDALARVGRRPVHDRRQAIELLLEAFPETPADLIVGLPGDDLAGIEQSFRDVLDLGFRAVQVFRMSVFPGTLLARDVGDYLGGRPVVESSHGAVLSSPSFPPAAQAAAANLVHALEIAAPLVRTRRVLAKRTEPSKLLDLATSLSAERLLELRAAIVAPGPGRMLSRLWGVLDELEDALGSAGEIRHALAIDLLERARGCASARMQRSFFWDRDGRARRVSEVRVDLPDGVSLCWDLARNTLSEESALPEHGVLQDHVLLLREPDRGQPQLVARR